MVGQSIHVVNLTYIRLIQWEPAFSCKTTVDEVLQKMLDEKMREFWLRLAKFAEDNYLDKNDLFAKHPYVANTVKRETKTET